MLQEEEDYRHLKYPIKAHTRPDELTYLLGETRTLLEHMMQRGYFKDLKQSLDLADPCEPGHLRERAKLENDIKWHDRDQVYKKPAHHIVYRNVL